MTETAAGPSARLLKHLRQVDNQPPKPAPIRLNAFLREQLRGFEVPVVTVMVLSGTIAIVEVRLFGRLGALVDVLGAGGADGAMQPLLEILGLVGLLPFLVFGNSHNMNQALKVHLPAAVRWRAHRWLLEQSLQFYQQQFAGTLASKVMRCADAVRDITLKVGNILVYVGVYFISIILLAATLDWRLAIPLLVWVLAYGWLLNFFLPRLKALSTLHAGAANDFNGCLVDAYSNITTVKLFAQAGHEQEYARGALTRLVERGQPQMRQLTLMNTSLVTINALLTASVVWLSFTLWRDGSITAGAIAAAVAAVLRIISFAEWILWEVGALSESIGIARDAADALAQPAAVLDKPNARELPSPNGEVRFEGVTFNYPGGSVLFDNFSLAIERREKVGLVGRSGAGKSTLLQLLLRLYEPTTGRVMLDGVDIADCKQASVRAAVAVVTQDTALLHRTVGENLLYARAEASDLEIERALRAAGALEFVSQLRDANGATGLAAEVGDRGVSLSGGQRQRLSIARALLKDAPILLLDEATAALDSETEAAIQDSLQALMVEKTVLVVAHRLSTLKQMDRIIVLDRGRIVEQGRHDELLKMRGVYSELWKHQTLGDTESCDSDSGRSTPPLTARAQ